MKTFKVGDKIRVIKSCGSLKKGQIFVLKDCGISCAAIDESLKGYKINASLVTCGGSETWIYHYSIYPYIVKDEVKSNKPAWF